MMDYCAGGQQYAASNSGFRWRKSADDVQETTHQSNIISIK